MTKIDGGRYYGVTREGMVEIEDPPREPDAWVCRRVEDFPGGIPPAGAATAACCGCGKAIAYNPARSMAAPKSCMQCNAITPVPMDASPPRDIDDADLIDSEEMRELIRRIQNLDLIEPSPGWEERALERWQREKGNRTMTATNFVPYRTTYAQYLAVESCSEAKHEFIDSVIVAMAGASDEHNAIASQLLVLLYGRTRAGCRAYNPDQKFWIEASGNARYSDVSIICGPAQHPAHDPQATTNPLVLVEVLSPSTQRDDHGSKRRDFQTMPSLQAYVLVAQDRRSVAVYRRGDHGGPWGGLQHLDSDSIDLPGLATPITVAEIYDGILDADGRSLLR